jgi:hypothetical protein
MAKIQYCTCRVNLAGQNCHIVKFDEYNPVTWPEAQVLMALHGDENVMDVMPVSIGEVFPSQEKDRLIQMYGFRVVEACFPGRAFRMQLAMTDDEGLPAYVERGARKVNGDDEDDDDEEVKKNLAATAPVFKPGTHQPAKEA